MSHSACKFCSAICKSPPPPFRRICLNKWPHEEGDRPSCHLCRAFCFQHCRLRVGPGLIVIVRIEDNSLNFLRDKLASRNDGASKSKLKMRPLSQLCAQSRKRCILRKPASKRSLLMRTGRYERMRKPYLKATGKIQKTKEQNLSSRRQLYADLKWRWVGLRIVRKEIWTHLHRRN